MSKIAESIKTLQALIDASEVSHCVQSTLSEVIHDLRNAESVMQMMEGRDNSKGNVVKLQRPGGVYQVKKLDHLIERMGVAKEAHPLDVSQQDLEDAHQFLSALKKHPGCDHLGEDNYVVVKHPEHVGEEVIDSIRAYLLAYGDGQHSADKLRLQAQMTGSHSMNVMPEWFAGTYGHISKGGFASLCYHTMIMAQLDPSFEERIPHISISEMKVLEDKLKNGEIPSIKIPKALQQNEKASQ